MQTVSAAFLAAAPNTRARAARLYLCDSGTLDVISEVTAEVIAGTATQDRTRGPIRRDVSLQVSNPEGIRTPQDVDDTWYLNRVIRVDRGLVLPTGEEVVTLGHFLLDKPRVTVTSSGVALQVSGRDRAKRGIHSTFTEPVRYLAGAALVDVLLDMGRRAGLGTTLYRLLAIGDLALGADRVYEESDLVLQAAEALLADHGAQWYAAADGWMEAAMLPTADTLGDPVWTFQRGATSVLTSVSVEWDDDAYRNRVVVTGQSANLNLGPSPRVPRGEARDLDPTSPGYNPVDGSGPMGDRPDFYSSADVTTDAQALLVAQSRLLDLALISESVDLQGLSLPFLEAGDVIRVVEAYAGLATDYLLDVITLPIAGGSMSVRAKRVRTL